MPLSRITCDLAFETDAMGRCTAPGAQAAVVALRAAIAAARVHAVWPSEREDCACAAEHVCQHADGGACSTPTEIGVRPVKRVAVAKVETVGEVIR